MAKITDLKGFCYPLSPEGTCSLLGNFPWHYGTEYLNIAYRTDPDALAKWIPEPLTLSKEHPDIAYVAFSRWWSVWEDHKELVEIPMRWETQDFPYLAYGYGFPRGKSRIPVYDQVLENWTDEWEACYDMGFCYGIKFDPQVTGTPGRIYMVDKILRRIRETGAWTATGEELARYTHNYYTRER